jgi:hypothetical protein
MTDGSAPRQHDDDDRPMSYKEAYHEAINALEMRKKWVKLLVRITSVLAIGFTAMMVGAVVLMSLFVDLRAQTTSNAELIERNRAERIQYQNEAEQAHCDVLDAVGGVPRIREGVTPSDRHNCEPQPVPSTPDDD